MSALPQPLSKLPPNCPPALVDALAARHAHVEAAWQGSMRVYLRAAAGDTSLFGRYSLDPHDRDVFAHEAAVRASLADAQAVHSPPIVERGPLWSLERAIEPEPFQGPAVIDAAIAASGALAEIELPPGPARRRGFSSSLRRLPFLYESPLPVRDVIRAMRVRESLTLPSVTSHGDFSVGTAGQRHLANLMFADGRLWLVDWELCGRRPAGYDLMRLWCDLELQEDRQRLFEGAVALLGEHRRAELLGLRYVMLVTTIANMLGAVEDEISDVPGGHELLGLLREVRDGVPVH